MGREEFLEQLYRSMYAPLLRYAQYALEGDALLAETDVLVDGPFVAAQKSYDALFRGSTNQRLIDMAATRAAGRVVLWTRPNPLGHFTIPES